MRGRLLKGGEDKIGSLGLRPSWCAPAGPLPIKAETLPAGSVIFFLPAPISKQACLGTNKKKRL